MPRPIDNLDELDALPIFSIVARNEVPYTKVDGEWYLPASTHRFSSASLLLNGNAVLIHNPERPGHAPQD